MPFVGEPNLADLSATAVVGLGLGMVTQVLVLAAQNRRDSKDLGVATAGTALFRSLGGALGVAIFGAIFANELHTHLGNVAPADSDIISAAASSRLATFWIVACILST